MEDKEKYILDQKINVLLTEYTEIRAEMKLNIQQQTTLLATAMTTVGITVGFAIALLDKNIILNPNIHLAIKFLLFVVIPGISTFFAVLWLDQVFRQLRVAAYTRNIEQHLQRVLLSDTNRVFFPKGYETFLDDLAEKNPLNVHRYYYYICLGAFLILPLISIIGCLIVEGMPKDFLSALFITGSIVIYVLGLVFGSIFVHNILKLFKETGRSSRLNQKKGLVFYLLKKIGNVISWVKNHLKKP
jgi:hypothetical protein